MDGEPRTVPDAPPPAPGGGGARRRRRRRWPWIAGAGLLVLVLAAAAVGCWLASSALLVPDHDLLRYDVGVEHATARDVTLERTQASERAGVYGLVWKGGHAVVGRLRARGSDRVTRELRDVHGRLAPGVEAAIQASVWSGTPRSALGIPFTRVDVADPLGPMPAWRVRGRGATWVLFVHGLDGSRADGLRALTALRRARVPTLVISYRNDAGAPPSRDGLIHLGMTEWRDLQAAARWAIAHGARRLVLYGESMGGAIALRFMHESPLAGRVAGIVLDAPVLDWRSVISGQASRLHVPFMAAPVEWTVGARIDIDWDALDEISQARSFSVPMLLFQGLADRLVPPADGRAFAARARPGLVRYEGFPGAGHVQSWNSDPPRYDRLLTRFLHPLAR